MRNENERKAQGICRLDACESTMKNVLHNGFCLVDNGTIGIHLPGPETLP